MSSARLSIISLVALVAIASAQAAGVSRLVEYRSPLDDSLQAYGVYLPASGPPSDVGYPAVLHGHGYGWSVSTNFGSFNREWADRHGWVLINLNARGPNFYEGVGDFETLRVVEHAAAQFGLDRDRIFMTGGSMGGTGALRHGLRHPDVFAAVMGVDGWSDFRLWHKHWYARTDYPELIEEFRRPLLQAASPLYWAERGLLGAIGHIVDGADTTVWPENGLRLYEQLRALMIEDPGGYDHRLIFNPELGHGRGTDYVAIYEFFRGRQRVRDPRGFHIATTRTAARPPLLGTHRQLPPRWHLRLASGRLRRRPRRRTDAEPGRIHALPRRRPPGRARQRPRLRRRHPLLPRPARDPDTAGGHR
jgi:acetyl esterase/lipase